MSGAIVLAKCQMVGGSDDLQRLDFALDHEEVEDDVETFARFGRARERVEKIPPRMRVIRRSG